MTETLEKSIMAICPSCKKLAKFVYLDEQTWGEFRTALYDCQECGSTLTYRWILQNNLIRREMGDIAA